MSHVEGALVLIIEDERELADIFQRFFERDGFRVAVAGDGASGLDLHRSLRPDLVVLDVRLPRKDGIEVLSRLRHEGGTPVIMSSALGEDLEKLTALRLGADDYLVKPFNPLELVARAKAVLRRSAGSGGPESVLRVGTLAIDLAAHEVTVGEPAVAVAVALTRTEFRILAHMARAPRKVFSRAEIVDACLPSEGDALERTVDSHVGNLRAKLERAGAPPLLTNVRGVGYRLAGSGAAGAP